MNKLRKFIEEAVAPHPDRRLPRPALYHDALCRCVWTHRISDTLVRFGMNGVMVLAMVPMIQSGCGLNFGLPLGIIAGLLGAVTSVQLDLHGLPGILAPG